VVLTFCIVRSVKQEGCLATVDRGMYLEYTCLNFNPLVYDLAQYCGILIVSRSTSVDNADAVAADVTTTIMSQRLELDDKNKSIVMLQKALVSCVETPYMFVRPL